MRAILYMMGQLRRYAGRILYMNFVGMIVVGFLEGLGILLLMPLLGMSGIIDVDTAGIPILGMFDIFNQWPQNIGLPIVLAIFLMIVVGQAVLQRNMQLRNMKIHTGFINHVRLRTYRAILTAKWDFFIKRRKSDLINSLTGELGRVAGGIQMFMQLLTSIATTLIQLVIAFWLSPSMTVLVLLCGLALALLSRKFVAKSKVLGKEMRELSKSYLAGITDHFNGIKDIKSNMLEASRYDWLHGWSQRTFHERVEQTKVNTKSQLYYNVASAGLIALFIYLSVVLLHARIEQIVLIMLIFSRLWPRFSSIQSNMESISSTIPALQALLELQEECKHAEEQESAIRVSSQVSPLHLRAGLECRGIYFRYDATDSNYALQDMSLHVPANRMTAVVGRSGAGKSTLIDILMGLLKPEKGCVLVDGKPLEGELLRRLRQSISYVSQDPFLFNGSIRDNLLMVKRNASEDEMWESLTFSSAAEFVRELPEGLDTMVGDRGIRLSGGERQRLVLARAILKKPSILVLDEATSALDTDNEAKIQQAIEHMKGKMTIVVIAHRLSTIRNADQVMVLEQGRLIQKGAFGQLASEKRGMFSSLLQNQEASV